MRHRFHRHHRQMVCSLRSWSWFHRVLHPHRTMRHRRRLYRLRHTFRHHHHRSECLMHPSSWFHRVLLLRQSNRHHRHQYLQPNRSQHRLRVRLVRHHRLCPEMLQHRSGMRPVLQYRHRLAMQVQLVRHRYHRHHCQHLLRS